jgi:hypothetical protein
MIDIVDERQDSLAIIDLEDAFTTAAETTPGNVGKGSLASVISSARSRNFDSSYAAAYHPWTRVRGRGETIIADCPPSVAAIGAIAKSIVAASDNLVVRLALLLPHLLRLLTKATVMIFTKSTLTQSHDSKVSS